MRNLPSSSNHRSDGKTVVRPADRVLRDALAALTLFVALLAVYLVDRIQAGFARTSGGSDPPAVERNSTPAGGTSENSPARSGASAAAEPELTPIAQQDEATTQPGPAPEEPHEPKLSFDEHVAPFLKQHCLDCHTGDTAEAGLQLELFTKAEDVIEHRKAFENVLKYVRGQIMPPPDKAEAPPAEDRDRVVAYLDDALFNVDCGRDRDVGRVTIRRLNRDEYNNTIRDLVGIDFQPAKDFPADDVGYGFDNIGDVLSLPTILMEKYLAAAEQITEKAIVGNPASLLAKNYTAGDMEGGGEDGEFRGLSSNGHITLRHEFPRDGEYLIRVRAEGQQAGPDPCEMQVSLEGKRQEVFQVANHRGEEQHYECKITTDAGQRRLSFSFINDYYRPNEQDPKLRGDRNLYVGPVEIQGPLGDKSAVPETHARIINCTPSEGRSSQDCAKEILANFARRAWRRPVTEEEIQRLARFVNMAEENGETFEQGIQVALQAVLVSPHFLFKIELDPEPDNPEAIRTLNEHELAVRLSYFLWSSMPDDELFRHADAGTLRQNLEPQMRRMIADPKSGEFVKNFAGQWLQLRNLYTMQPDRKKFPAWNVPLREAMREETEAFFTYVMREDRSILELIDADYAFLNEKMAKHYGIDGVEGREFRKVALSSGARGGVLTQASVLTVTSDPTRTSPVKRGKFILENILGTEPPPPPPNVEPLKGDGEELTGTLRQQMEQHRTNASCSVCHQQMDPLGFGLENFDGIGAWRDAEGKFPIDASGELPGGRKFAGPAELKAILKADDEQFRRCLSEKMLTYALGRGLEYYDRCWINEITKQLSAGGDKFGTLVLAVVESEAFQKRRGKK